MPPAGSSVTATARNAFRSSAYFACMKAWPLESGWNVPAEILALSVTSQT